MWQMNGALVQKNLACLQGRIPNKLGPLLNLPTRYFFDSMKRG